MSNLISNAVIVKRIDTRKRLKARHSVEFLSNRNDTRDQEGRWDIRFNSQKEYDDYKLKDRERAKKKTR